MSSFGHCWEGGSWHCLHCGAFIVSLEASSKCPGAGDAAVAAPSAESTEDAGERLMRAIREASVG